MDIVRRLEDLPKRAKGGVVTIGKFDGLHLGHAAILARALEIAKRKNAPAVLFTFDPSPAKILCPEKASENLCDLEHKLELCERSGLDATIVFPTTREFLKTPPRVFFNEIVVDALEAVALVEGADFCFGRGKEGNDELLSRLCAENGIGFDVVSPFSIDGELASSSAIRASLSSGDVERASRFLGRPYRLRGIVERGDRRGRTLGYPTANLGRTTSVVPAPSLYAAIARTSSGETRAAAVNVGGNPTFGVDKLKIEAHLLDFSGDLYDSPLSLDFVARLRGVTTFASKDALLEQMRLDVKRTREIVRPFL